MKNESYFTTRDNHRLYCETWAPESPKAVLIFVHGLNEHIGRYAHVAHFFSDEYTCHLYDQRGHGRSEGVRAFAESFGNFSADLDEFVNKVKTESGPLKIFIVGHSMGGQVVLNYLGQYSSANLSGFITSSANIQIGWKVNPIKKYLGVKLSSFFPKLTLPRELDEKYICRDENVVRAYVADPLVNHSITLSLAREILANQDVILENAPRIEIPALMMHAGDDHISASDGTVEFFEHLGSKDKTLKIYDGFYHELFNEFDKEHVFQDIKSWLAKRI